MGLFGGTQVKTNMEDLVRNVMGWIVVVTARFLRSYR